jgi:hypothetical protein
MNKSPAWELGYKHGNFDADKGNCIKVQRVMDMAPDDYSDGYRAAIVDFIRRMHNRLN